MAVAQPSFLQDLQNTNNVPFYNNSNNITAWNDGDDDDESFEVGEINANTFSGDINLAEALRSIRQENTPAAPHSALSTPTVTSPPSVVSRDIDDDSTRSSSGTGGDIPGTCNIKEELRSKIQTRRLSQGVGELKVTFDAPKSYPLSWEERRKVELRKKRNRNSANKSRIRRKQYEDCLIEEVKKLEEENDRFEKEIKQQTKIKQTFQKLLDHHMKTYHQTTNSPPVNSVSFKRPTSALGGSNNVELTKQPVITMCHHKWCN